MHQPLRIARLLPAACLAAVFGWAGQSMAEQDGAQANQAHDTAVEPSVVVKASATENGSVTKVFVNGVEIDPADAGKHGVEIEWHNGQGADLDQVKRQMRDMLDKINVQGIDLDNLKPGEAFTRVIVNGEAVDPADAEKHGV